MSIPVLRPYQTDFVDGIRAAFRRTKSVIGVAPTGAGKGVCFAYITANAAAKGKRVTIIAHRTEIVEQISIALSAMGVSHGRIAAGQPMADDPIQIAMVQTLARRLDRVKQPDMIVSDECHHFVSATWLKVREAWPDAYLLGVTATPIRLDGAPLGKYFSELVIGPTVKTLIAGGFLAPIKYLAPPPKVDLSGIKTRLGDYAVDELGIAMDKKSITGDAIEHYARHINGKPAIAFCVTVDHARHVAEEFTAAGYRAASVDGTMGREQRRDVMASIGDGRIDVLTSCELISEGIDVPVVSGAILLRPTKSLGLFLQQVGRAVRPKPGGDHAVILDHVGNVRHHGLPDMDREWSLVTKVKTLAPVKTCDVCYRTFATHPKWREEQTCDWEPEYPPDCALVPVPVTGNERLPPGKVHGLLEEITSSNHWTGRLSLVSATGRDWYELLDRADTEEKLRQIAIARGYRRGWVQHVLRSRAPGASGRDI